MEADLQKRIADAKAQGFTDEEIRQALQSNTGQSAQTPTTTIRNYDVPVLSAEEKARLNQSQQAVEASNTRQNIETGAVAAGLGAAALGVPAALYYGGKAILSPAARATTDLAQRGVAAAENIGKTMGATEQRVAANQAAKQAAPMAPQARPVAPSPILNQYGQPIVSGGPVAPSGMPAPAPTATAQPNAIQRGADYVRQMAMNRILPAASNLPGAGMVGQAGKFAGKLLPGAGTVLNAADAYNRAQQGDYLGAGIAGIGAAASPFPVVGTAIGLGAGGLNAYLDYRKRQGQR